MSDSLIRLEHSSGARAEIFRFGATIKSFYPASHKDNDILFLSKKAVTNCTKAIRGGIPIVFPVFGAAYELPNHGFARISNDWKFEFLGEEGDEGTSPVIGVFTLHDNEYTRSIWPHKFVLRYTVRVYADSLKTSLQVHNPSEEELQFQILFHTYLACDDVSKDCRIEGLKGISYFDKVHSMEKTEQHDAICITEETDRIYKEAPNKLLALLNRSNGETLTIMIEKDSFFHGDPQRATKSDAVLWNPWIDKSKQMSDFADDEYLKMVCLEVGCVNRPLKLGPKKKFEMQQTIRAFFD